MAIGPLVVHGLPVFGGGIKRLILRGLTTGTSPPPPVNVTVCLSAASTWPMALEASTTHNRECDGTGMGALYQNFTLQNETDPVLQFTMEDLTDVSGWGLSFYLARTPGATNPTGFPLTVGSGITVTGTGIFAAAFSTNSPTVLSGTYAWSVYRTDSGFRDCLAEGTLFIEQTANPP